MGVESKFTEWMTPKRDRRASLAPYFRKSPSLWEAAGLTSCARLAADVHDGAEKFLHLDVPQLLKHSLGLKRAGAPSWTLMYLWFDPEGDSGETHREELARFEQLVGQELGFKAATYQTLVLDLTRLAGQQANSA